MKTVKKILRKVLGLKPFQRILAHRQILSSFRAEPDFIIVGVQKGGTTSLFNYLEKHPEVGTTFIKETHFFNWAYYKGLSYYKAFFPLKINTKGKITGESSPDYVDNPYVPERIAKHYPNIKLIFIFRNPTDRAYSHYKMTCTFEGNQENKPFEEAVFLEDDRLKDIRRKMEEDPTFYDLRYCFHNYLSKGHYADQLNNWLKYFKRDQILILKSEDLFENPERIYEETEAFLGINHFPQTSFKKYNSREYDGIKPEIRKKLDEYYKEKNEEFYQLIGKRYWN